MIGREKRMRLRHYMEQGMSITALSQRLGISRDTIHRWIRNGELDRDLDRDVVRYRPRPPVPTKLGPYKPIIRARLEAYPELSGVRLLEEVRAAGYTGGGPESSHLTARPSGGLWRRSAMRSIWSPLLLRRSDGPTKQCSRRKYAT